MARLRTIGRWIAWGTAGFAAVFVALVAGAYVYVQTETGRRMLADTVGEALSGPDQTVSVGSIGPKLPTSLSVGSLAVSDDQGTVADR